MCGFDYCARNLHGSILFVNNGEHWRYCKENSFKGAESFDINKSSELDGYVLCVSKDGDDSKGQELFIFYEKPFGAIKNTNRYALEYQSNESGAQLVGSYLF